MAIQEDKRLAREWLWFVGCAAVMAALKIRAGADGNRFTAGDLWELFGVTVASYLFTVVVRVTVWALKTIQK